MVRVFTEPFDTSMVYRLGMAGAGLAGSAGRMALGATAGRAAGAGAGAWALPKRVDMTVPGSAET